jgi:hypothetical protein
MEEGCSHGRQKIKNKMIFDGNCTLDFDSTSAACFSSVIVIECLLLLSMIIISTLRL